VDDSASGGWHRLGTAVRQARIEIGYTSRENFAEASNVSVRVIADLESGARSNFSDKVLSRVESALGWVTGTMDQIVADARFVPPQPSSSDDLIFRQPEFDRRPVPVDVSAVERAMAALTETARDPQSASVKRIAETTVGLCWPYVIRLIEDNCLPGNELHPAVRPLYETFLTVASQFSPSDPGGQYVRWLAGDSEAVADPVRHRYMQRWSDSRRAHRGRRARSDVTSPDD
jgi:transcriptional regulator with XRE-family HTH domain